jgi:hypothetical protein
MQKNLTYKYGSSLAIIASLGLILSACKTSPKQTPATNPFTVYFTGWPKKSIERLLPQFMESKSFLVSRGRDGTLRFDKKSSNWDHFKYGSFLEPNAWVRLEPTISEEKDSLQTDVTVQVSIITHRQSSLEETRKANKHHLQEARDLMHDFEMIMLQPVNVESVSETGNQTPAITDQ